VVAGHADRSGQATYNMTLSRKRADAVGAKFAAYTKGDPTQRVQAVGEAKPLAATRDGIRHPRNRRVEIMIGRL
jgi:outer membrane protein OmpA-like peptidoglycan-associated protein